MSATPLITRAIYRAVNIKGLDAPYDTAHLKIYYPAKLTENEQERNSGVVPASLSLAPFPVVILMPGINLGHEAYRWFAEDFAKRGIVTVTYNLVAKEMPGFTSLTPGLDLQQLSPENYGKNPSAIVIEPIINELNNLQKDSVLSELLDLNTLILGGHSAGGTMALLNARPDWFPGIKACFSYGSHSGAAIVLGYPDDTLLSIPSDLPIMMIGGTRDGCITESNHRYGSESMQGPTERIKRSFYEAVTAHRNDAYLLLVNGANHFSLAHPIDNTAGRNFLDIPTIGSDENIRNFLSSSIRLFIKAHACHDKQAAASFEKLIKNNSNLIAKFVQK